MIWAPKVKIPEKNYLVITLLEFLAMFAFKISKKLSIGLKNAFQKCCLIILLALLILLQLKSDGTNLTYLEK